MSSLATARDAIQSEIKFLIAEQKRLQSILDQLGSSNDADTAGPKKRGRKSAVEKARSTEADVAKALQHIEAAGKGGVKAIRLASLLKKDGYSKVAKEALLGTEKIKMTGKGGGTTYVFVG